MKHKLLVSGGRDFEDIELVYYFLDRFHYNPDKGIFILIHGAAKGLDTLASRWAKDRKVMEFPFVPEYDKFENKKLAPLARNQKMIDIGKPTCAMIFPGQGWNTDMTREGGTADMFRKCMKAGLHTYQIINDHKVIEFNKK